MSAKFTSSHESEDIDDDWRSGWWSRHSFRYRLLASEGVAALFRFKRLRAMASGHLASCAG
jgi:hypothetical protein